MDGLIGGIRRGNSLACRRGVAQIKNELGTMSKAGNALQRWLETHGLLTIAIAVLGVAIALSTVMVVGGYFLVSP